MKYWYDTEFYEDGNRIHLISIGIETEDGRELYLENGEFDWEIVPPGHWLWKNVYPHLSHDKSYSKDAIAREVHRFITNDYTELDNQLWGYYSSYDYVVLAQLFGTLVNMPPGIPWFTRCIKQELERIRETYHVPNLELPVQVSTEHHALEDARWTRKAHLHLIDVERLYNL